MSEENNDQQQQQKSQEQQLQDLNFSINDILSHNHDVDDSSFQSIVQTLSNNSNEQHTPSYAHLPAELQDLLSNEADDLLSPQGSNSDASLLTNDMHLWNQQAFISSPVVNPSPSSALSTPPIQPQQPQTPTPPIPIASTPTSTTATTTPVGTPASTSAPGKRRRRKKYIYTLSSSLTTNIHIFIYSYSFFYYAFG